MIIKNDIAFPFSVNKPASISIEHFGFDIKRDEQNNTNLSYKKGCTVNFTDHSTIISIRAFYDGKVIKTSLQKPFKLKGDESFTFNKNGFVFSSDYINFMFGDIDSHNKDSQPLANFNPLTKQRFHLIFEGDFIFDSALNFDSSDKIKVNGKDTIIATLPPPPPPPNPNPDDERIVTCTVYGITEDGRYFDPIKYILELLQLSSENPSTGDTAKDTLYKFKDGLKIYSPTLIKHNATINVIGFNGNEIDSDVGLVKKDSIHTILSSINDDTKELVIWIVDDGNRGVNTIYETGDRFNIIIIGNENTPSLTTKNSTIESIIKLSRFLVQGGVYKPFNLELNGLEFNGGNSDKGGAIACYSLDSVIIRNCSFIENKATQYGGALYFENCENVLISSDLKLNITFPDVNQEYDCSLPLNSYSTNNNLFEENTSTQGGGAIEAISTNITLNNCVFNNNKVQNLNTDKSGYGGAIGFTQESISTGKSFLVRYINIYSSVFNSNSSELGGAFALTSWDNLKFMVGNPDSDLLGSLDETLLTFSYPKAIIKDCLMQNNEALRGGGVLITNSDYTITNSDFICNRCINEDGKRDGNGASICNYVNIKGIIKNCAFLYGDAGVGGAIYSSVTMGLRLSKKIIIEDSYFKNNKAYNGGALRFTGGTSLEVKGSTFDSNYAEGSTGFGGAISFRTAKVNIKEGVNFINNIAKKGGAIHGGGYWLQGLTDKYTYGYLFLAANFTSSLIIEGDENNKVNFKDNCSVEEGAAIFVVRDWLCFADNFSRFVIKNCHLETNRAYCTSPTIDGSIITLVGFNRMNLKKKIFSLNKDLFDINKQDCNDIPSSVLNIVIFYIKNTSIIHNNNLPIFSLINSSSAKQTIENTISDNLTIKETINSNKLTSDEFINNEFYIKEEEL